MPENDNNPLSFFQELKRRKVIRVIIVYAAAAFAILELVSIIAEPFGLPDWTIKLVFVILCIGLIISIILSWIYDIHPEEGIVKTEPAHKVKPEDIPKSSNSWKIASYISFVVIIGLIVFNIVPRINRSEVKEILDKSIAVMPFRSLSDDPEKQYLADGAMDVILLHLSKIKDLRVMARTSVEQYRETDKTATAICQELDVAFLLEGSFQKYGNQARLIVQLIEPGKEGHIWAKEYDRNWTDIFSVQSEVAQSIARELQAVITPAEKQLIEKIPTNSLTAYDFYQRGREEYLKNWVENRDNIALERAEELFLKALEIDSSFAQVYIGLARLYWAKHGFRNYLSETYLDSILFLCNLALSYDDKLAEAYTIKGFYYAENGNGEQAIKEFDKALVYNPNDWETYRWKGRLYATNDMVEYIKNYHKAVSLNHDSELPSLLRLLAAAYAFAGFIEKTHFYHYEAFKLDHDSVVYFSDLAFAQENLGHFDKSAELLLKAFEMDTNRTNILIQIGLLYMYDGQFEEMLRYFQKFYNRVESSRGVNVENMHRLGYAYWMNGYKKEADYYFDTMIEYYENLLIQERVSRGAYYDLAGVYAFRGEKNKAYEYLRIFNQEEKIPRWWLELFKRDPLFNSIRDEPKFQQIDKDLEAKYQAEHERVRKWLEENDML